MPASPTSVNRQAFSDGWFRTGDRGRLDADGRLFITGRSKLLIDVMGDKVDPIEVEDVLAVHPKVREVVVVGVAGPVEGEQLLKAVVVADERCGSASSSAIARSASPTTRSPGWSSSGTRSRAARSGRCCATTSDEEGDAWS